jgi:hypothetical protein
MSWTMLALVLVAWCLVSVVAGFAFALFFGGMNRIHPDELDKERLERFRRDTAAAERARGTRRGKGRARATYRPLAASGPADAPLDEE